MTPSKIKAIIPVAGVGSRLRPHTHTTPKALIHVAGRPILAHILDDLERLGVTDVVLVVGHMSEHIRAYVDTHYARFTRSYVDQPERLGLGHAVRLTRDLVIGHPAFIVLGDTIFRADFSSVVAGGESAIGVHEVEDPRRFGIVETDASGYASRLVEKPDQPTSNLAIVGVYYLTDSAKLFGALDTLVEKDLKTKGEYQLTDALELMIEGGHRIRPFRVDGWYDCGKTETLLETNRELLDRNTGAPVIAPPGTVIVPPVAIDPTAVIERSIIGPHVSIAARAVVREAVVKDSIVNEDAVVEQILLAGSVIGENALVRGTFRHLNVGDSSEVRMG